MCEEKIDWANDPLNKESLERPMPNAFKALFEDFKNELECPLPFPYGPLPKGTKGKTVFKRYKNLSEEE